MKLFQLLGLHLFVAVWLYGCGATVWGDLAAKSYVSRMQAKNWLMPGKFAEKAYWIRSQKVMAIASLPFILFIYLGVLATLFE